MPGLAITCHVAFVLTAEIEKDDSTKSGYRCADQQMTRGGRLYGDVRYLGVAAMTRLGFAERVLIVGGKEMRYPDENIIRSTAFKAILEQDFGAVGVIDGDLSGEGNTTMTSFDVIRRAMAEQPAARCAVITSFYHAVRTHAQLVSKGIALPVYPAEAFTLIEDPAYKPGLVEDFGRGDFAARVVNEIQGVADLLAGKYQ